MPDASYASDTDAQTHSSGNHTAPLRLMADDIESLGVLSAVLQDAIISVGKMSYDARAHAFTVQATRFKHEKPEAKKRILKRRKKADLQDAAQRVQTIIRFDNIIGAKARGLRKQDPDAFAVLLSIQFHPDTDSSDELTSGKIHLTFAGGGDIHLMTEYIDVRLMDASAPRAAKSLPEHGT